MIKTQRPQSGFTRPSSPHRPLFMVQDGILTWPISKYWGLTDRTWRVRRPSPHPSLGRCLWLPHWPPSPPCPPPLPRLPVPQLRSSRRRWDRRRKPHPARPSSGWWGGGLLRYTAAQLLPGSNCPPEGLGISLNPSLIRAVVVLNELSQPGTSATLEGFGNYVCTGEDESCTGFTGINEMTKCSLSPCLITLAYLCMGPNPNMASCFGALFDPGNKF